jgi:hypothetical protein
MQNYFLDTQYRTITTTIGTAAQRVLAMTQIVEGEDPSEKAAAWAFFLTKAEEVIDELRTKQAALTVAIKKVVEQTPTEVTYLPLGARIEEVGALVGIDVHGVHSKQGDGKRNMGTQTDPAKMADADCMTRLSSMDGQTTMVHRSDLIDRGTQITEMKCSAQIDKVTAPHWHSFRRLHFQRLYWRFRIRKAVRRVVPTPTGHCRLVMNAFVGMRQVLTRQIRLLELIKSAADPFEDYGSSWVRYVGKLNDRQRLLLSVILSTFDSTFEFIQHNVRHMILAPVPPIEASPLVGSKNLAFQAKEESVKRLLKRKPWLFCQDLGESFGTAHGNDGFDPSQGHSPSPPRIPALKSKAYGSPRSDRIVAEPQGVARFVAASGLPFRLPGIEQDGGAETARSVRENPSRGKRVPFACADCLRAKANHQAVPLCRNTGCVVAKTFSRVENQYTFSLGPK